MRPYSHKVLAKMFKDKPVISNQHGALAMAVVPFIYGSFLTKPHLEQLFLGLSWLFLYFFSYPFFSLFSKKPTKRNQKWAAIYFVLSLIFALPVLLAKPSILQFLVFILPLGGVQMYYAKKRDERHILNDLAGVLTFGIMGMASAYLSSESYQWWVLIHPTLFFLTTILYVKSIARERRNPIYMELSLLSHILFGVVYLWFGAYWLYAAYLVALLRACIVPSFSLNIKQAGMLEFPVVTFFLIALLI